jgi:hypothetical protein
MEGSYSYVSARTILSKEEIKQTEREENMGRYQKKTIELVVDQGLMGRI